MRYRKTYYRDFAWKFQAENFADALKKAAKRVGRRVKVEILPVRSFVSSGAQRWKWHHKLRGEMPAETKTVGYRVKWEYLPPKR